MTPGDGGVPKDAGDKAQERVSRLLAAAGSQDRTMPEEVAARLDDVLTNLVAETTGPVPSDQVAGSRQLASKRRSVGRRLLLAAASVFVLALGAGVVVDQIAGSGSHTMTAESGAAGARAGQERSPRPAGPDRDAAVPTPGSNLAQSPPVRVRASTLSADLRRIDESGLAATVAPGSRRWRDACVHPRTGGGDEWLPVRFDGRPAVLVLRAPSAGRRTGEVFLCGSTDTGTDKPAASATIEAR